MDSPIYVLHIITESSNYFKQKTCSMCVNDFIDQYVGHFENGMWISDEIDVDIVYHRQYLLDGYAPPVILIDLVRWLQDMGLWVDWMSQFDQLALVKQYISG